MWIDIAEKIYHFYDLGPPCTEYTDLFLNLDADTSPGDALEVESPPSR